LLDDIEHHEFDVFCHRPQVGLVARVLTTVSSAIPTWRAKSRKPLRAPAGLDALIALASKQT
jgi:hypothetical protein